MKVLSSFGCAAVLCLLSASLQGATLQIQSLEGVLHFGGIPTPYASFTSTSPEFISLLNPDNTGSFQFTWTNNLGTTVSDVTWAIFLDLDIDRDTNTFFNEFGAFVSASLPILSPAGAIGFSDWEIDEPEYTFGNIYTNVYAAALDNSNGVPSSGPADDVSHALLFRVAELGAGDTFTVTGTISLTDAAGLAQFDPDSNVTIYFNGFAMADSAVPTGIPEPATATLVAGVLATMWWRRR